MRTLLFKILQYTAIAGLLSSVPAEVGAQPAAEFNLNLETTLPQGYVLGNGDELQITVFGYEEYSGTQVILPDGTISLPLIGVIQAAGLTSEQLAQTLRQRLDPFLVEPAVTVSLAKLRSLVVNVAGAVQRPGPVNFSHEEQSNQEQLMPIVASALIKAGGITPEADIRRVLLRRVVNGIEQEIPIDLWDAIANGAVMNTLALQDGDSIFVPQSTGTTRVEQQLLSRSRFAPETIRVRVVGEVKQPGEIVIPPDGSISSAVAIAGGPTEDAKLSQVVYVRRNEAGEVERQVIDLRTLTDDYQVQAGDVVIVPKKNVSSVLDFAARLVGPLGLLLGIP